MPKNAPVVWKDMAFPGLIFCIGLGLTVKSGDQRDVYVQLSLQSLA